MPHDIQRNEIEDELDWLAMSPDVWCARETAGDDEMLVDLVFDALADAEVAADCIAALDPDKGIPHDAVKVKVVDGWVTLSGEVQDEDERREPSTPSRQWTESWASRTTSWSQATVWLRARSLSRSRGPSGAASSSTNPS